MKKIRTVALGLAVAAGLLLSGCATTGPAYAPVSAVPPGKAVVYVYREPGVIGGAVAYEVSANGTPVSRLPAGSYFVYYAAPGEVELSAQTEAKTSVTLDVVAGGTYYVKGTVGIGVIVGHPHLVSVESEVGEREIAACKFVGGSEGANAAGQVVPKSFGPFSTAVVAIDLKDLGASDAAGGALQPEVVDRRTQVVMERTTVGHTAMSGVVLQPGEVELVRAVVAGKMQETERARPGVLGATPLRCEIREFSVTTPATLLYWDVTTRVEIALRIGDGERIVEGLASERTYVFPSVDLIKSTTTRALQKVAQQAGPAIAELLPAAGARP